MKLINLTNLVMIYTLKLFNTGQVTLPKAWRSKFKTKNFIAEETKNGLLIKPLTKDELVYYETDEEFGIYCENGIDMDKFEKAIKKIHG